MTQEEKQKKKDLRKQVMARISSLDEAYTRQADSQIVECLLSLPEYREAKSVFCFVGTDHEINTTPFLERVLADGKELCVPLCVGKHEMQARHITSLSQLKPGFYGLLEPDPDSGVTVGPRTIDLAVIPCVSCSHDGARLGHGGGFYDVYFSRNPQISNNRFFYNDRIIVIIVALYDMVLCVQKFK